MSQDTPLLNELDLSAYWMPFTANRQFKANPRLFVAAEGMHYTSADGRKVLDGTAGLLSWTLKGYARLVGYAACASLCGFLQPRRRGLASAETWGAWQSPERLRLKRVTPRHRNPVIGSDAIRVALRRRFHKSLRWAANDKLDSNFRQNLYFAPNLTPIVSRSPATSP